MNKDIETIRKNLEMLEAAFLGQGKTSVFKNIREAIARLETRQKPIVNNKDIEAIREVLKSNLSVIIGNLKEEGHSQEFIDNNVHVERTREALARLSEQQKPTIPVDPKTVKALHVSELSDEDMDAFMEAEVPEQPNLTKLMTEPSVLEQPALDVEALKREVDEELNQHYRKHGAVFNVVSFIIDAVAQRGHLRLVPEYEKVEGLDAAMRLFEAQHKSQLDFCYEGGEKDLQFCVNVFYKAAYFYKAMIAAAQEGGE